MKTNTEQSTNMEIDLMVALRREDSLPSPVSAKEDVAEMSQESGLTIELPRSAFEVTSAEMTAVPLGEQSPFAQVISWHPHEIRNQNIISFDNIRPEKVLIAPSHKLKGPIVRFDFSTPSPDKIRLRMWPHPKQK